MGISRSAACAISYLMICREMTAADAICTVRLHRKFKFQTFFHKNENLIVLFPIFLRQVLFIRMKGFENN